MTDKTNVLDKGYIRLVNTMGTDLDIVNSARASFEKESHSMSETDEKLIDFLIREKHDSTLRHAAMTFEVYAPLMVARQWYKHAVASTHLDDQMGWNESSRRYITENEQFYIPDATQWRSAPENAKQGSAEPLDPEEAAFFTKRLNEYVALGEEMYNHALRNNMAAEQARLFLPAYGMYVRWRWTASLNSLLHFLSQRLESHAQYEIREYATAIEKYVADAFPIALEKWKLHRV